MDQLTDQIKLDNIIIELAKEKEVGDVFIAFASREGFVDLFEMGKTPKFIETDWGANEFKATLKMVERSCPGLIEFKKKGWNGLWGYPVVRVTKKGKLVAKLLLDSRKIESR